MSWQHILQNDRPEGTLRQRIDALFVQQREGWPMLRDGEASLGQLQRKTLTSGGDSVVVQVNPARRRSTLAKNRCPICGRSPLLFVSRKYAD